MGKEGGKWEIPVILSTIKIKILKHDRQTKAIKTHHCSILKFIFNVKYI